jgi:hypothetical protein
VIRPERRNGNRNSDAYYGYVLITSQNEPAID